MKYYDINTKGFYENPTENSIEITEEKWQELLDKQSQGGTIQNIDGQVMCVMPTDEQIVEQETKIQAQKNITKRQLLVWLFTQKQKTEDDIFNVIETIQDTAQRYLAKVNYGGTNNFYYGNEFVPLIGQALGLTIDEIKTMFDEASKL